MGRRLKEGDAVAGFRVVHLPGHTRGHMALFRESDGVALVGDVINTNDYLTGMIFFGAGIAAGVFVGSGGESGVDQEVVGVGAEGGVCGAWAGVAGYGEVGTVCGEVGVRGWEGGL